MFKKKIINKPFFGKYEFSHKKQIILTRILARFVLISILVLISKSDIEDNKSRSRLDAWDWRTFFRSCLNAWDCVSNILASSRCVRLNRRNSGLEIE